MLRQIEAFTGKFRWAFDQSAPSAFALVRRERRIEQKVDLGRGLLLDFRLVVADRSTLVRRAGG